MRLRRRTAAPNGAQSEPAATPATTATEYEDAPVARTGTVTRAERPGEPVAGRRPYRNEPVAEQAPADTAPGGRRRRGRRAHNAAGAAAGAIGAGVLALARLVMTVAGLIALLIVLAIVLRDVDANASNSIVKGIHEGANFFAGAFTGLITFAGHPKRAITIDWGIAAVAYLVVGAIVSRLIASIGRGGVGFERRHRAVPMH